jgi:hypothetical protein
MLRDLKQHIDRNTFSLVSRYYGLKRIFDRIDMDEIINKCKREGLNKYKKDYNREGDLLSIVGMHIYDMGSVDELHDALSSNQALSCSCNFLKGAPSRSQMSRDINSMDLEFVIKVFDEVRRTAKRLGVYKETEHSEVINELKELGDYLLISTDSSVLILNKSLFPFLKIGHCTLTGKQEYGMKIHVGHCINADATTALEVTNADVHETNKFEALITQTIQVCGTIKLIIVMDKGYYDHQRFQFLCDAGIYFVTPRKKYSLKKAVLYPDEDVEKIIEDKRVVDGFIKLNDMKTRLRWIRIYEEGKEEPFELLTNIFDCPVEVIIAIYGERWPIELLFKDVKQNFGLRQPIGRTLNAVLFHIYAVFIAYLVLQILRHLLGGEYTGLSMLKFRRELQYSDALRVIMPKPPPNKNLKMENGIPIVSPLFYCEFSVFLLVMSLSVCSYHVSSPKNTNYYSSC